MKRASSIVSGHSDPVFPVEQDYATEDNGPTA
jgi:hypothetical protein